MRTHWMRALIAGAAALTTGLLVALPGAAPASAKVSAPTSVAGKIPTIRPGHALLDVGVRHTVTPAQALRAATSSSFPQFKATVTVAGKSYTYVMAGKNPAVKTAAPASTVNTELVPLVIKFPNGDTWDPTKTDSCDPGASTLTRVQNSALVKPHPWTWGGTQIGTGQLTDAFQRAEFWKYAKPGGINPGYGVSLAWKTLKPVTINVPLADAATAKIGCGNKLLGAVELNWLDSYLQKTLIPALRAQGVGPSTVPVFVLHNVVEFIGTTTQCCVIGYHNAYNVTGGVQTYALSEYDNSGAFGAGFADITALTHELGEWQNDPYTTNPTPPWGNTGQVQGCQANLEVGDPLTGTNFTDTVGGFTYHPQELAFASWFYHQKPSQGVNGWYSSQGTFSRPAAACPPTEYSELKAVSARTASDAWAVGFQFNFNAGEPDLSLIRHWDGTRWTRVASPNPGGTSGGGRTELLGVSAVSASDAWAVGFYSSSTTSGGSLIVHWDGTRWTQVPSPSPGSLEAVSAASATDAWAVGSGPRGSLIEHWNGTRWAQVPSPSPGSGADLRGVTAVSATDAWAVGADSQGSLIEHWNGTRWAQVPSPSPGSGADLRGVTAVSATDAWAVGYYVDINGAARTLILRWNGTSWTRVPSPNPTLNNNNLYSVTATSASDAWAAGSDSVSTFDGWMSAPMMLHWNGTHWANSPLPTAPGGFGLLEGVTATSASSAFAVGLSSLGPYYPSFPDQALVMHWDGKTWR